MNRIAIVIALGLAVTASGTAAALDSNPDRTASIGLGINVGISGLQYNPDKTAGGAIAPENKYGGGVFDIVLDGRFPLSRRLTLTTGIILDTNSVENGKDATPITRYDYGAIIVNVGIRFYLGN
jgi:hypothetical protein